MAKNKTITIEDKSILIYSQKNEDFISLTDMARFKNAEVTGIVISHWLSTRNTVEFMGLWEQINNPNFNVTEFRNIKNESGSNGTQSSPTAKATSARPWTSRPSCRRFISREYCNV